MGRFALIQWQLESSAHALLGWDLHSLAGLEYDDGFPGSVLTRAALRQLNMDLEAVPLMV